MVKRFFGNLVIALRKSNGAFVGRMEDGLKRLHSSISLSFTPPYKRDYKIQGGRAAQ